MKNLVVRYLVVILCLFALLLSPKAYAYEYNTISDTYSVSQKQIVISSDDDLQNSLIYDTQTNIVYFKSANGDIYPYFSPHGNLYSYENGELKEVSNTDTHYVILLFCIITLLCLLPINFDIVRTHRNREDYLREWELSKYDRIQKDIQDIRNSRR